MVLHASGSISASQIRSEFNQNTSGTFFLGSNGRSLDARLPQSGPISFSNFYNKYYKQTSNLRVWLDAKEYSGSGTTWTDLQGNANATLVNTPTFAKPYFDFNGTNQYATLADLDNITDFTTASNYTISCWVWISSSQNFGDVDIVEKWAESGGYPYVLRFFPANSYVNVAAYNPSPVSNPGAATPNNSIIVNDWNHFSAVFNWSTLTISISVNGVLSVANSVANPGTINNSSLLYLMARGVPTNYVNGRLGMLMIHNTALNGIDVSRMYYATRNVFEIDTIELENGTWNIVYEYINPKRNVSSALVTVKDNATALGTPTVNRIGYFMQNNMGNGSTSYWIFVTMNAYTSTLSQIKIPDLTNIFTNQRNVTNLRIYSNHPQVGHYHAANGRLEIWPYNYSQTSNLGGGSGATYDFDDTAAANGEYGSVQVHDITNSKTLLAWNNHPSNATQDIGIGNNDATNIHYSSASGHPDWTFAANGAYNWKFQVLIGTIPIEPTTMETGTWRLLYELTNSRRNADGMLVYAKNNSALLGDRQFTKVGYYMQNNMNNGPTSYYVYVTMDVYTSSLRDLKIPDNVDAFINQRNVQNLTIYSNHPQVGNYSAANGRLEIWPYNYAGTSNLGGGSGATWDFDDTPSIVANGHGSCQVHDITNSKTLLAWNMHRSTGGQDIGIGNNDATNIHYDSSGGPDWTAAENGAYNWKFQVYIKI